MSIHLTQSEACIFKIALVKKIRNTCQGYVQYCGGYEGLRKFSSTELIAILIAINIFAAARLVTRSIVINLRSPM